MKYVIYCLIAALIAWSVYYLIRRIYRMIRGGGGCDGCCGSCPRDCPARDRKEKRDKQ